jgi:hypothetical protein
MRWRNDGSLSEQMIKDLIEDSYDLVVSQLPTSRHRALGSTSDAVGVWSTRSTQAKYFPKAA